MSNDKVAATFHGADGEVDLLGALGAAIGRAKDNRAQCDHGGHPHGRCVACGKTWDHEPAPDLTPEQDLRAAIADMLAHATHFNGCPGGTHTCRCLIGRLNWAINAEEITS